MLMEAEAAERRACRSSRSPSPRCYAVIDHAQTAVARGFEQAHGVRAARARTPHSLGAGPRNA